MNAKALKISAGLLIGAAVFLLTGAVSVRAARRMRDEGAVSNDQVRAVSRNAVFLLCVGATALAFGVWILLGVALGS